MVISSSTFLRYKDKPSKKVTIDNAGNVGIGTINPKSLLHLGGLTPTLTLGVNDYGGGLGLGLGGLTVREAGGGLGGYLDFQTLHWGSAPYGLQTRMSIDYNGNVGIGTTSPSYKLDVSSPSFNTLRLTRTTAGAGVNMGFVNGDNSTAEIEFTGEERLDFENPAGTKRLSIQSDGNVGIGTTSPTHKLNVVGDANITGNITAKSGTFTGPAKYDVRKEFVKPKYI